MLIPEGETGDTETCENEHKLPHDGTKRLEYCVDSHHDYDNHCKHMLLLLLSCNLVKKSSKMIKI